MSLGVIVGRFQVHELHDGHIQFIDSVIEKHRKVIIFLGVANTLVTRNNPLDFITRKKMILEEYPDVTVLPIKDVRSDDEWSETLDSKIKEVYNIDNDVTLYGSRDSFIQYYNGQFDCQEFEQRHFISGTEVRKNLSDEVVGSRDFRAGVIYAAYNQFPKVHPVVDILIYRNNEILLGRKPKEDSWRFVGGFVDPKDENYEAAAKREAYEETKLELSEFDYVGSWKIDDWRYRSENEKLITTLFMAKYIFGRPTPSDDISELQWFHIDQLSKIDIVPEHARMLESVLRSKFMDKVIH